MNKRKLPHPPLRVCLPIGLSLAASSSAFAQDAQVQDVVVTAPAEPQPSDVAAFSEKQATAFQNSPQSTTVITEQQLQNLQITNLQEAQRLEPSLNYKFSNVRNLTINIRGFGAASSNATDGILGGVPTYIDGVYQPRPGQAIFDVPDLVGIEVLKGPRGTSGGQDSTGGVVNLSTALPSFVQQEAAEASYGNYGFVQFKGSATGPLAGSDTLAYRLSLFSSDHEGYLPNYYGAQRFNDWHDKGGRFQLLYTPSADLTARFSFDYSHVNQACCIALFQGAATTYANGAIVPNNWYQRVARVGFFPPTSGAPQNYEAAYIGYQQTAQESYGAAANINYTFNGFDLSSITSFRGWDFHPNNRSNFGTVELITNTNGHVYENSVTQDFKLSTPKGLPVEASAGVFYLWEQLYDWGLTTYGANAGAFYGAPTNSAALNNAIYDYLGRQSYDNPETQEIAPYSQAVWHATPELDLTGGARYSYYAKTSIFRQYQFSVQPLSQFTPKQQASALATINSFIGPDRQYPANTNHGFFSALASASYKFQPDVLGYVTYARGGRDGGPNPTANLPIGVPTTVLPETLDSFEAGVKGQFLDNRLLANVAVFTMIDHNYITTATAILPSGATVSYLANAQSAISRGVEADIRYQPIDGLTSYFSVTYDDAFYGSFNNAPCPFELSYQKSCNFTGLRLSLTPRWAMAGGVEYSSNLGQLLDFVPKPLVGYAGIDFTFQTSTYSDTTDSIYSVIPAYALLNLHAGVKFADNSWDLSAWVHNATNVHYWINVVASAQGLISGNVGDPLTFGVTLRAKL